MELSDGSLHLSRYRFVVAGLVLAAHFCVGLNIFAVSPILPLIIEDLAISRANAGLLVALAPLVAALFGLPGGAVTVRLGLKRTFAAGWFAMALLVLSAVAPNFSTLLALRLVYGLGLALVLTATGPLLIQWFKPREVLVMNGLNTAVLSLGIAVSLAVAAPLAGALDWQSSLGIFGGVGVLGTLAWVWLGPAPEKPDQQEALLSVSEITRILKSRPILLLLAADAGVLIQYTALSGWLPTFYSEARGMSLSQAGFLTGLLPLVGVFAVLAGAIMPLKFGSPKLYLIASGVLVILGGLGSFGLTNRAAIYGAVVLVGIGSWLYVPTLLSRSMELVGMIPRNVAIVWGSLITFSGIGMFIAPILVGALRDATGSFTLGFLICSGAAWSLLLAGILMPGSEVSRQSRQAGRASG